MHILLNPGPVNLSDRVRKALNKPDLCHRETEFSVLQDGIRQKLLNTYELDSKAWAAILLTGSGTSAMEAMLSSIPAKDSMVLIIENGVYGERLSKIANIYGIKHKAFHHEWGDRIDPSALAGQLSAEITHVALVHHETTTGRLNNIATITEVCQQYNIPLLVDGVSSFGAEELQFTNWNILACAGTANKCLHGVPGTSFVVVRRDALNTTNHVQRSLYLDLASYLRQQDKGGTPFTQSVQTFYALDEALDEHQEQGGWQQRQKSYWEKMDIVRDGLLQLGIQPLLDRNESSCVLNSFRLPEGIPYEELHDRLKESGFVIYAGQGGLAKSLFRISPMGTVTVADMQRLVDSITKIIG